jgi:hypothetical protein
MQEPVPDVAPLYNACSSYEFEYRILDDPELLKVKGLCVDRITSIAKPLNTHSDDWELTLRSWEIDDLSRFQSVVTYTGYEFKVDDPHRAYFRTLMKDCKAENIAKHRRLTDDEFEDCYRQYREWLENGKERELDDSPVSWKDGTWLGNDTWLGSVPTFSCGVLMTGRSVKLRVAC